MMEKPGGLKGSTSDLIGYERTGRSPRCRYRRYQRYYLVAARIALRYDKTAEKAVGSFTRSVDDGLPNAAPRVGK